jgi:xylulokinase
VVRNTWVTCGDLDAAGMSLNWLRAVVSPDPQEEYSFEAMEREASEIPAGSAGLLFLPYLMGERTPGQTDRSGAFLGLRLSHTRAHLVRSIMEGVCYALSGVLELLEREGIRVNEVILLGGAARSVLWSDIRANIYGRSVIPLPEGGGSLLGAALLAGEGIGLWANAGVKAAEIQAPGQVLEPRPELHQVYEVMKSKFREAYSKL